MLIGTAGHIDHGKTSLIKALTGIETDRLPEEKKRGITIELGYAYVPLDATKSLAFIDVPGHEKLIATMLSGAAGIDFALLVVAADDGVMPQTQEHLAILDLLGVKRGAVAITKCDRVDAEQIRYVQSQITTLLDQTGLSGIPCFEVSAQTGQGISALRTHLENVLTQEGGETAAPLGQGQGVRLAIDRHFALPGAGTIVTGTLSAGELNVGDALVIARTAWATEQMDPEHCARPVRVRSLHVNNRPAKTARRGSRCAVNLVGIEHHNLERGDWLCSPALARPTQRVECMLHLHATASALSHQTHVHVHHAASFASARMSLLENTENTGSGAITSGEPALVQMVLDRPLFLCSGDRLIVRDVSARQTLGVAHVLDPVGATRHRRTSARLTQLRSQYESDIPARMRAWLHHAPLGLEENTLMSMFNLETACLHNDSRPLPVYIPHREGRRLFSPENWQTLNERILARLAQHHDNVPDDAGVERSRLHRMVAPTLPAGVFWASLSQLVEAARIVKLGALYHLPTHSVRLSSADETLAAQILPLLAGEKAFDPPWVRDIALDISQPEAIVRALLKRLAQRGEVFQIIKDLFMTRESLQSLSEIISRLAQADGAVRAAALRDAIGGGRKRAIQILEFCDRVGFTRRVGAGNTLRHVIRGEPPV